LTFLETELVLVAWAVAARDPRSEVMSQAFVQIVFASTSATRKCSSPHRSSGSISARNLSCDLPIRAAMTMTPYQWCSPMTFLESELVLVAWAVAARDRRSEVMWQAFVQIAEIWIDLDGVRAKA